MSARAVTSGDIHSNEKHATLMMISPNKSPISKVTVLPPFPCIIYEENALFASSFAERATFPRSLRSSTFLLRRLLNSSVALHCAAHEFLALDDGACRVEHCLAGSRELFRGASPSP